MRREADRVFPMGGLSQTVRKTWWPRPTLTNGASDEPPVAEEWSEK